MDQNRVALAAVVVFASMSAVAWVDTFFILIAEVAGLWQFHLLRALIALPIMVIASKLTGIMILPRRVVPVMARAVAVSGSMICYFGSLSFLSVGQAAAGLFTSPLWVLVLTALVLRQGIGPRRLAAILFGFMGAMLVLGPEATDLNPAFALPIIGGFLYGLGAVATRTWCAGETAMSLLAAFFVCMIFWGSGGIALLTLVGVEAEPGTAGLLTRAWGDLNPTAMFWIFMQACISVVGIYGLTYAYQLAEASYVAVFEYSFLVFAVFWALVLFRDVPTVIEVTGIGLILLSGALIALSPAARAQHDIG